MNAPFRHDGIIGLRDQDDWMTWFDQIHARAVAKNVWVYFKPDNPLPFPVRPTLPEPPTLSEYPPARGIEEVTRPSELSAQGRAAFNKALKHYTRLSEIYEIEIDAYWNEQDNIRHMTQLIYSTVVPYLQHTCCLAKQPRQQWLANLKLEVGIDDHIEHDRNPELEQALRIDRSFERARVLEQDRSRARYRAALKPMRSPKAWHTWLSEYEQASHDATANRVLEATDSIAMMDDFVGALKHKGDDGQLSKSHEFVSSSVVKVTQGWPTTEDYSYLDEGSPSSKGIERDASSAAESASSTKRTRSGIRRKRQGNQASKTGGHQMMGSPRLEANSQHVIITMKSRIVFTSVKIEPLSSGSHKGLKHTPS
ncbi:hypothetical protein E4U37_002309 [Claviceps purpurea]|nr:hypothetical protein E4U37_002309 [Claviceps purpurea]